MSGVVVPITVEERRAFAIAVDHNCICLHDPSGTLTSECRLHIDLREDRIDIRPMVFVRRHLIDKLRVQEFTVS